AAGVLAVGKGGTEGHTGAHEAAVPELDLGEPAIDGRVSAGDIEIACVLLHHLDVENDAIRHRAGPGRELDGLEVAKVLQPPFGAVDETLVEGIALGDIEFAADHVTAGAGVAVDIDALDIGARPLGNLE